jgi:hypothetical protein
MTPPAPEPPKPADLVLYFRHQAAGGSEWAALRTFLKRALRSAGWRCTRIGPPPVEQTERDGSGI